jgi:hypothetical protein
VAAVVEGAGGAVRYRVDGIAAGCPDHAAFPALDGSLKLGWSGAASEYLNGDIGLVRIYNRGLAPAELQHNYLAEGWRFR